ncbi:Anaphase promoting complex Cdc20 subunits [Klebsormidium nitens]|uniref:Anaphase promoting complex Cdc20 subunits n=1 Tax=Klebsormidium nitens TaxID=105231 RepID=A0A1Y1I7F2_KLENI|nr:Anaphase promoting complex Cdc20 subunits [Klebsormidium nitens]|eukprot:GAQ84038.1 Anaphase promoting complex Cdc20 subunits [Klebsormidium nitens]
MATAMNEDVVRMDEDEPASPRGENPSSAFPPPSPSVSPTRNRLNLPPGMSRDTLQLNVDRQGPPLERRDSAPLQSITSLVFTVPNASNPTVSPTRVSYSDRFIPSRSASDLSKFALIDKSSNGVTLLDSREDGAAAYSSLLRAELLGGDNASSGSGASINEKVTSVTTGAALPKGSPISPTKNLFRFKSDASSKSGGSRPESPYSLSPVGSDNSLTGASTSPRRVPRKIARSPFKVLDAPSLQDDFYLNLVDWSSHNVLAVGLGTCVYLWSAHSSQVTKLCDLGPNDSVSSVGWTQRGTYLAVGTNLGEVQIWDAARCKKVRTMGGHRVRVGCLAWSSHMLSSGSRDRNILQRDVRAPDDYVSKLIGHKSEVCGLKWSYDDRELASGGNDNQLCVWNTSSTSPILKYGDHKAAVKAIAWSPHQHGLLASGGGTADRCIRFWNTATNTALSCLDTGSQVCNIAWSKNVNEIVTSHGYSQNQIVVWRYPSMSKLATLTGHTMRVLYLAVSPDGQTIVTGAGDETLRFWNVFPPPKTNSSVRDSSVWAMSRSHIR